MKVGEELQADRNGNKKVTRCTGMIKGQRNAQGHLRHINYQLLFCTMENKMKILVVVELILKASH